MNSSVVTHIFASLQGLEKCAARVRSELPEHRGAHPDIEAALPQQIEVLRQMRCTANKLQLHMAKQDWSSAVRSMQIFYGLNQMIRADVMAAFAKVSKPKAMVRNSKASAPIARTIH